MDVREIELGGVYNLGNYENLRISVRVAARPGKLGETLASLAETVDRLAEIAAALRKAASEAREIGVLDKSCVYLRDYNEYIEEARKYRELAEKQLEEVKQLSNLRSKIIELLRNEQIEEAYKLAKHLNGDHEEEVRQ